VIHVLSADRFSCMQMKFAMVVFRENCSENLVSSNHFLRDNEPWTPFLRIYNGLDDLKWQLLITFLK
jgi:hypothetical protein